MALTYRNVKGSALTINELDANFSYFTGSYAITGSLVVSQNITASNFIGNLQGTASYAINSGGGSVDTGSLLVTASNIGSTITYTKGDGSTFTNTINNVANAVSASYAVTASSLIDGVIFNGTISGSLIPAGPYIDYTSSYDLGSSTAAWKDLYLSNGTIYMLSSGGNGTISFDDTNNQFIFSTPNGISTTLNAGGIVNGAAQSYYGNTYGTSLYFTGSNFRSTNLAVILNQFTTIDIAPPDDYSPGTVVEFDIIAATGSAWTMRTVNPSGSLVNQFISSLNPNYTPPSTADDFQDFNPYWNNASTNPVWANLSSYFPQTVGGYYPSGSALIRLVAVNQFLTGNNTTIYSGSTAWFGRIIERTYF